MSDNVISMRTWLAAREPDGEDVWQPKGVAPAILAMGDAARLLCEDLSDIELDILRMVRMRCDAALDGAAV